MPSPIYRLFGVRSEGYECLMAMPGIAWAITLAMPMESSLRFDMGAHAALAPFWLWATVAGASAGFHLIGLLTRHRRIRLISCWISPCCLLVGVRHFHRRISPPVSTSSTPSRLLGLHLAQPGAVCSF